MVPEFSDTKKAQSQETLIWRKNEH